MNVLEKEGCDGCGQSTQVGGAKATGASPRGQVRQLYSHYKDSRRRGSHGSLAKGPREAAPQSLQGFLIVWHSYVDARLFVEFPRHPKIRARGVLTKASMVLLVVPPVPMQGSIMAFVFRPGLFGAPQRSCSWPLPRGLLGIAAAVVRPSWACGVLGALRVRGANALRSCVCAPACACPRAFLL